MKKEFIILFLVLILVNLFFYYGLPFLKNVKKDGDNIFSSPDLDSPGVISQRAVTVNISIEPICKNMLTDAPYRKCNEEFCDKTCKDEGCRYFSLFYEASTFEKNACLCHCLEENKIKKALSGQ